MPGARSVEGTTPRLSSASAWFDPGALSCPSQLVRLVHDHTDACVIARPKTVAISDGFVAPLLAMTTALFTEVKY
jgi:hypothetical protein